MMKSANQQTNNESQIHTQLQPGLENIVESQSRLDEQAQPQVHPALELQYQAQAPDTDVPQQPQVPHVAFQPQVHPALESQYQAQAPYTDVPQQPQIPQVAFLPEPEVQPEEVQVLAPPELQEPDMTTAAPRSFSQVQEAQIPIPAPAPIPGIHNPPEQIAEVVTSAYPSAQTFQPSDAVSELQQRASLAASRVQLMDATIDVLVETFKNKYQLDKELEKRCSKLLKASVLETTDRTLKEDLETLSNSLQWVQEQVQNLEECLLEKHRNMQLAVPLVNTKSERNKEEKQIKSIEKAARKIQQRAMNRDAAQMKKRKKQSEGRMVDEAWKQLHPSQ
ncbi:hypothetical protein ACEPAG_1923 [Sanghuangporus baumii]